MTPILDFDAIYRFLASPEAMERLPKEAPRDLPALDRHSHAQPHSGWAHRLPMGNPPRRQTREGGVMVMWDTPPIREPWLQTASEWEMYALCSQLRADHRRIEAKAAHREFRAEIMSMLKGAAVELTVLLLGMTAFWAAAWGLAAVIGR